MFQGVSHNNDSLYGNYLIRASAPTDDNKIFSVVVTYKGESCIIQKDRTVDDLKILLSEKDNFLESAEPKFSSPKKQIKALKNYIGFNVSEIADILRVGRPTIYEWLETETPNLRENNRKRLDELYGVYEQWAETHLGRLDTYLRKTIVNDKSLFDLLCCKKINHKLVKKVLASLEHIMKKAKEGKEISKNFISKYDLEKNTRKQKERMRKRHRSIA